MNASRILPDEYVWTPCSQCGYPQILTDSGSVNGGHYSKGCASCMLPVVQAAREKHREYTEVLLGDGSRDRALGAALRAMDGPSVAAQRPGAYGDGAAPRGDATDG